MRKAVFALVILAFFAQGAYSEPPRAAKVLVTLPNLQDKAYLAVAEVFAGTIVRDLNRAGAIEIIPRKTVTAWLKERNLPEWAVGDRKLALEAGKALGADVVIYANLNRTSLSFLYSMALLEVNRDVVQRVVNGAFPDVSDPSRIQTLVSADMKKIIRFIPLPTELTDPGLTIREKMVDPNALPQSVKIDLPPRDTFGDIEQVLSYYRTFPGDGEYMKLAVDQRITRIEIDDTDINDDLHQTLSRMQMYGEFALRYNMQAYLVKNCSVRTLNVLLANKIPVLWAQDEQNIGVLAGYEGLRSDGSSIFWSNTDEDIVSFSIQHRQLIAVLVIVPNPGRKGGISRESLQEIIGIYHNDWGKTPELVEIKEGLLDIISNGMEGY